MRALVNTLAAKSGISPSSVGRIWRAFGLKPWLPDTFKLSENPNLSTRFVMSPGCTRTNADIDNLDVNRGHRTLFIHRNGHKTATIPLAPRTARALDLHIGERTAGPIFLNLDGTRRLDRHGAARIVRRLTKCAGIDKKISPHSLRHSFITAALDAGVPIRDVQEAASHSDPRITMRYDRGRGSLDRHPPYIVATFVAGASR